MITFAEGHLNLENAGENASEDGTDVHVWVEEFDICVVLHLADRDGFASTLFLEPEDADHIAQQLQSMAAKVAAENLERDQYYSQPVTDA